MIGISLLTLRHLPAHAGAGDQRRLRDLRAGAPPRARARRHARLPRLPADDRDRRRGAAGGGRAGVPRLTHDARPDRRDEPRRRTPRPAAAAFRRLRRAPFPAQRDAAAGGLAAHRDERARPPARGVPRVLLARRAALPQGRLRVDREAQPARDHDLEPRGLDARAPPRRPVRPDPPDLPRHRPRVLHARRRATRGLSPLPGKELAAQEPRAPVRGAAASSRAGGSC